jgi:hypothetical protein
MREIDRQQVPECARNAPGFGRQEREAARLRADKTGDRREAEGE